MLPYKRVFQFIILYSFGLVLALSEITVASLSDLRVSRTEYSTYYKARFYNSRNSH